MKFNPNTGQVLPGSADSSNMEIASPNISSTVHTQNLALQNQSATPISVQAASPPPPAPEIRDTIMSDNALENPASPAVPTGATNAPSPAPPRTGTPSRNLNGDNSRAASLHPEPSTMPKEAPPHGAPTRQYLNGKVTGALLEGMKHLAKEQPRDPLRVLGEYLIQKSRELEGT